MPPVGLALEWWEAERGVSKPVDVEDVRECAECLGRGVPRGGTPGVCIECHGSGRIHRVTETTDVRLLEVHTCSVCGGRGHEAVAACSSCGGVGRTAATSTIRVRIPAGVGDGDLLQVDGIGRRFRLSVTSRPRDSRLVLLVSAAALAAAVGLLLYLVLR